jgi:hypothetical protein
MQQELHMQLHCLLFFAPRLQSRFNTLIAFAASSHWLQLVLVLESRLALSANVQVSALGAMPTDATKKDTQTSFSQRHKTQRDL